jgi:hypothetical protein
VGLLAQVEDQIVGCFRHGGGVPYSEFPKFQAIMAEDSGAVHDATLVDMALLRLVSRRHAEPATAGWRQITKASSSNATATRRSTGASTASS